MVFDAAAAALGPETLGAADPLLVNEAEAAFLLGGATRPDPTIAGELALATALLGLGSHSVVLTLGARGAVDVERVQGASPRASHVPARPVVARAVLFNPAA